MAGFVSDTLRLVQSPGQSSVPGLGQEESGEETEQTRPSEHRLRQPVHLVHLPQPGDVGDGEHPQGPDHVAEAEAESPDLGGEELTGVEVARAEGRCGSELAKQEIK